MATLYDISWAFTVYHLLQLPLNATGHKRQSSPHFTKGKGGRSPVQILQPQKSFHMLKCTIVDRFIESFGNSNSACFEGWVISTAYPRVLISQFESAVQQRCAPGWDRGTAGAHFQVWWSCLLSSRLDVVSAIH